MQIARLHLSTLGFALVLGSACSSEEAPAEPQARATACPITKKTLLVTPPEDLVIEPGIQTGLAVFDNDILFTFDPSDAPDREYWRLDRCSGALERYPALVPGLHRPRMITTDQGRVVYANDDQDRVVLVDRFDVPGADEPQMVPGLPETAEILVATGSLSSAPFARFWDRPRSSPGDRYCVHAAGLGCYTYSYYTHTGDAAPALEVSTQLLSGFYNDELHQLIHEDDGTVRMFNAMTGDDELLLTGVRYVGYIRDHRYFIWQAIADDEVEPVYRHDLATGEDLQIAVNDFTAQSWRVPEYEVGQWQSNEPGTVAAMIGPGGVFVMAVDMETGDPLAVPPHVGKTWQNSHEFGLVQADDNDEASEVQVLWNPLTGQVREWYRGRRGPDEPLPNLRRVHENLAYYQLTSPRESRTTIWQVDLDTGVSTQIAANVPFSANWINNELLLIPDLTLLNAVTGETTTIATDISGGAYLRPEGLLYLDLTGDEPGLWAYPVPFATID